MANTQGLQGFLPDPVLRPKECLEALIMRIAATDKEGFFMWPVDERITPGYHAVVKHPMCFSYMKSKVLQDSYSTWRDYVADFELIVSNAKLFNKPGSKVNRCALSLQKNMSKLLKQHEAEMRKAFQVLYPSAAAAADAAEAAAGLAMPQAMMPVQAVSAGGGTSEATSHDIGSAERPGSPSRLGGSMTTLPDSVKIEPGILSGMGPAAPTLPLPPMPREHLCPYISDNEEEDVALQHLAFQQPITADLGMQPALPDAHLHHCLQPVESVLMQLRVSVLQQSWPRNDSGSKAAPGSQGHAPSCQGGKQAQGRPAELLAPSGRSSEWKSARRPTEWQCRWLELRMHELKAQQHRIEAALAAGPPPPPPRKPAATTNPSSTGCSATVASELAHRQSALASASSRFLQGGPSHVCGTGAANRQEIGLDLRPSPLASNLFFQLRAGKAACSQHMPTAPPTQTQPTPAPAASQQGSGDALPSTLVPAALFTGLEALEQQLQGLRRGLTSAFRLERVHGGPLRGSRAVSMASGGQRGGAGGGSLATRRSGMRHGRPGGGLSIVTKSAGSDFVKRKRSDSDLGDLGGWNTPLASLASMRSADRAVSTAIYIPPVRELPEEEWNARMEASTTWAQAYKEQGVVALANPPPVVATVLAVARDEEAEADISSEDTSDECYRALHAAMEEEERKRFAAFAAEGQRRRGQSGSKNSNSKHSQVAKNQAQQQGKQGMKTPRGQRTDDSTQFLASSSAALQQLLPSASAGSLLQGAGSLQPIPEPSQPGAVRASQDAAAGSMPPPPLPTSAAQQQAASGASPGQGLASLVLLPPADQPHAPLANCTGSVSTAIPEPSEKSAPCAPHPQPSVVPAVAAAAEPQATVAAAAAAASTLAMAEATVVQSKCAVSTAVPAKPLPAQTNPGSSQAAQAVNEPLARNEADCESSSGGEDHEGSDCSFVSATDGEGESEEMGESKNSKKRAKSDGDGRNGKRVKGGAAVRRSSNGNHTHKVR